MIVCVLGASQFAISKCPDLHTHKQTQLTLTMPSVPGKGGPLL